LAPRFYAPNKPFGASAAIAASSPPGREYTAMEDFTVNDDEWSYYDCGN